MGVEADIYNALKGLAPTTPWASADQNNRPRITFQRIHGDLNMHLNGPGPARTLMQLDVYADDVETARGLAEQAKVALLAGLTVGELKDNPDGFDASTKLHWCSFDVAIW